MLAQRHNSVSKIESFCEVKKSTRASEHLDALFFDKSGDIDGNLNLVRAIFDHKCCEYTVVVQILALDVFACEHVGKGLGHLVGFFLDSVKVSWAVAVPAESWKLATSTV